MADMACKTSSCEAGVSCAGDLSNSKKKHSNLRSAYAVAAVYFGAIIGPDLVGGSYAVVYFAPYGAWSIVCILLCTAIIGFMIGMGAEIPRRCHVYNYADYAHVLYGRLSKVCLPLLELYILFAMVLGGSSVAAMGGQFFNTVFGWANIWGALLTCGISALLVLWGDRLVRASSTVMSVIMIVAFLFISGYIVTHNGEKLAQLFSNWEMPGGTLRVGLTGAAAMGMSNAVNSISMSAVEQNIRNRAESVWIGVLCFLLTTLSFALSTFCILPYAPDILVESVPTLVIIRTYIVEHLPWLPAVYYVLMFFALISSGSPQLHTIASRFVHLYPDKSVFRSTVARNAVTAVIYFAVCIGISTFGIIAIVSKGFSLLGYLGLPLIVIPVCVITPIRFWRKKIPTAEE